MTEPADPSKLAGREGLIGTASRGAADGLYVRVPRSPDDEQKLTLRRTTDARTALARGLTEYLGGLSIIWDGGRRMFFERTYTSWAEPEKPAKYPSLVLVGSVPADYEAAMLTPALVASQDGQRNVYLRQVAEMKQMFQLIVWCQDPVERMALTTLVEDAMEPHDWMTGLRLELPYYFNARATYEKLNLSYDDTGEDAQRRWRRSVFTVMANVPQYRPVGTLVPMLPQTKVITEDTLTEPTGMVGSPS